MLLLRLSVAGTVLFILLGGIGSATMAQDDAEPAPGAPRDAAVFDGTMPYPYNYLIGRTETVAEPAKRTTRGDGWEARFTDVSDPRLAGVYRSIINRDSHLGEQESDVSVGAHRIDNADGSWFGPLTGYRHPDGGMRWHSVLTGAGAYEGLSAIIFMEGDRGARSYDVHGTIFPGAPPEVPDYPEPAE